jgi:hypothetical protein
VSGLFFEWDKGVRFIFRMKKINLTPLLSHKDHFIGRWMKHWCNVQVHFTDLRHRPLGGLLQLLFSIVGARPAGDC